MVIHCGMLKERTAHAKPRYPGSLSGAQPPAPSSPSTYMRAQSRSCLTYAFKGQVEVDDGTRKFTQNVVNKKIVKCGCPKCKSSGVKGDECTCGKHVEEAAGPSTAEEDRKSESKEGKKAA
ncbi:hypothetical protein CEP54_002107 [Fusarium duplospermum]|uniref:Uncharacterized protein n=1 Tax=Fusarium duplospermum TaxID=1325734 RepID=A0A428QX00_9HYPO|nr:hypothetical protein CEP54_002107 [Fusarium duplospermum]